MKKKYRYIKENLVNLRNTWPGIWPKIDPNLFTETR